MIDPKLKEGVWIGGVSTRASLARRFAISFFCIYLLLGSTITFLNQSVQLLQALGWLARP